VSPLHAACRQTTRDNRRINFRTHPKSVIPNNIRVIRVIRGFLFEAATNHTNFTIRADVRGDSLMRVPTDIVIGKVFPIDAIPVIWKKPRMWLAVLPAAVCGGG
jgi:hypothetical protein